MTPSQCLWDAPPGYSEQMIYVPPGAARQAELARGTSGAGVITDEGHGRTPRPQGLKEMWGGGDPHSVEAHCKLGWA